MKAMNIQREKFKWDDDSNLPSNTQTVNAQQLAGLLLKARINFSRARSIELSKGNLDVNRIRRFLRDNGGFDWVLANVKD